MLRPWLISAHGMVGLANASRTTRAARAAATAAVALAQASPGRRAAVGATVVVVAAARRTNIGISPTRRRWTLPTGMMAGCGRSDGRAAESERRTAAAPSRLLLGASTRRPVNGLAAPSAAKPGPVEAGVRSAEHGVGRMAGVPAKSPFEADTITDMSIIRDMLRYLWPRDRPALKARVVLALLLLVGGKVLNVQVPYLFKLAVDTLNVPLDTMSASNAPTIAMAILVGCSCTRRCVLAGPCVRR